MENETIALVSIAIFVIFIFAGSHWLSRQHKKYEEQELMRKAEFLEQIKNKSILNCANRYLQNQNTWNIVEVYGGKHDDRLSKTKINSGWIYKLETDKNSSITFVPFEKDESYD